MIIRDRFFKNTNGILITFIIISMLINWNGAEAITQGYYKTGLLVCSPKNSTCGFITTCNKSICTIMATHIIENGVAIRYKPNFIKKKSIKKNTIFPSNVTVSDIIQSVKNTLNNAQKNRFHRVLPLYNVGYIAAGTPKSLTFSQN